MDRDPLERYLIEEAVEDYAEGRLSRRQAMTMLTGLVGAVLGAQLLAACKRSDRAKDAAAAPLRGPQVAPDDPEIVAAAADFAGTDGAALHGYLARPAKDGPHAVVLVCHENKGLTPHIEDVTRRVAKAGYVGMAVDLLSREGGTAKYSADDVPGVLNAAPPERHANDFIAGLAHARTQVAARQDRVGMTGFCFGGGITWRVAAALPELRAAVPFYGQPIDAAEVPKIQAAVLAIYAGEDDRTNQQIPAIEEAMLQQGKTFRKIIYPGVQHAFHNDTGERYDATAAKAAWAETLTWFAQHLA